MQKGGGVIVYMYVVDDMEGGEIWGKSQVQ